MKSTKLTALALSAALCLCACSEIPEPADPSPSGEGSTPDTAGQPSSEQTSEQPSSQQTTAQTTPPLLNENIDYAAFEERIEEIAASLGVVGMGLSVFAGGEVVYTTNYGYADREAGIPADGGTLYRTASVSKLISTMVLMTLYDDGILTPYSELEALTGFPYNTPASSAPVLLWHLLTHTAGLVDGYAYENGPSGKSSMSYVLSNSYSGYAPGAIYSYSNFGAGSIGGIVEKLTGEFFHDYADRVLFEPLGMDAGYCIDLISSRDNAANLYSYGALQYTVRSWGRTTSYYESYGLGNSYLTAQCELLITTDDLARLGILLAGDGTLDGKRILSSEATDLINATYFTDPSLDFDVGLNVRKYSGNLVEGRTIYGHPGQALGSVNGLYYDPSDGTGVAICSVGCTASVNGDNGVYVLLDECINEVYGAFFD